MGGFPAFTCVRNTGEHGDTETVLNRPAHPYTDAMIKMSLQAHAELEPKSKLPSLPGAVPTLRHMPIGCRLGPSCPYAQKQCVKAPLVRHRDEQSYYCHFPLNEPEA